MSEYGLKEYKELLEKALVCYQDPLSVPVEMDPYSKSANVWRAAKMEAILYALEMLPQEP